MSNGNDNEVRKRVLTDLDRCIECRSCSAACYYGHAAMPIVTFALAGPMHLPVICRQCKAPSCVEACPWDAMVRDESGVVRRLLFRCRGCGSCVRACPFGLISDLAKRQVPKCDLCEDRVTEGKPPRCVAACPSGALQFEDEKKAEELRLLVLGGRTTGDHPVRRARG